MTSGTSRKLLVRTDESSASEAIRRLWAGLPYDDKNIKLDELPKDFWGTFLARGPGFPLKRFNKVHLFSEVRKKKYDQVQIKIEVVIGDPIFGQGAFKIVGRCIIILARYFQRRGCEVISVRPIFGPYIILKR